MTWHMGARLWAVMTVVTASVAGGCGSSGGKRASIELLAPEDKAVLTIDDDIDPDMPGVQYEVRATTRNIRAGTVMLLVMPGESTTFFTDVDEEGEVVFEKATLPPGPHTFHITTATGSVSSPEYAYTLRTLVIDSPRDGQGIAFGDDIAPEQDGLQINVTVKAYAIDGNEDIELSIDDAVVGDPVSPDESGVAVFQNVTLETGEHRLRARAGNVESSEATVSVNEACASVSYVSPELGSGDRVRLAGGDACPEPGEEYTIDVVVSTDAGDGREVELTVNNTTKQRTRVEGSLARFDAVVLNRRMTANELSVTVQAEGVTCRPVPFPKEIFVDCDGSDCGIGSPIPFSGHDGDGEPAFYLNRSMLNGDGFDIRVDSDVGVLGEQLELIIDGRDGRSALRAEGQPNGSVVSATFEGVELAPGEHVIEARCRDAAGNVTESGELRWVVDVDACEVEVEAPEDGTQVLREDDLDSDESNGVQVQLRASVEGSDCIEARAAVCDPSEGISGAPFEAIEGSSVEQSLTLASGSQPQSLCVEARDRADNAELASVSVRYRSEVPMVQIESPVDATVVNAQGNGGRSADENPDTPACEADFDVLCTDVGRAVELRRDDASGPVLATATCEEPVGGDPELPDGFAGRARLDDVVFLPAGQDSGSVVATQSITGISGQSLIGVSPAVSLMGWCEPPSVTLFPGCPDEQLELPGGGGSVVVSTVQALYSGSVVSRAPDEARLEVVSASGDTLHTDTATFSSGSYQFMNVDLGDVEQEVETRILLTDDFENTSTVICPTTVVSDLPELTIASPTSGAALGPNDGCDAGEADRYGVPVELELDQTAMRELGYTVDDGALQSVAITDTSMSVCVPVRDGSSTLTFRLGSSSSAGAARQSIDVQANALSILEPAEDAVLLDGDDFCDPGFGAHIVAEVAPAFEGSAVTIGDGSSSVTTTVSGGMIDACLRLEQGPSTVTVSLDGKMVSRSIRVAVVTSSPSNTITLTGVTLPDAANYRSGQITLAWAQPQQDFPGQLTGYELRCATTALSAGATDQAKEEWWDAARGIPLAGTVTPPATSAPVDIRIGESLHCVLRGSDAADQLTPIGESMVVSYPFRELKVDVSELSRMGYALAAVGDVNDDNVNDVLVGGTGRAFLYFGKAGGLETKSMPNRPDVTFIGAAGVVAEYDFGTRVVSLGDLNGDGESDFAIAHPTFSATGPTVNITGAVYVFYGRKAGDSWPATVDLTSTDPSQCGADVCFIGELTNEFLGFGLAAAGDYNGDGRGDLAIGAPGRNGFVGRLYILMGRRFEGSGGTRPTQFWNIPLRLPSSAPIGFYVDGAGATGMDASSSAQMGNAVASVGNVDGSTGADLLINAAGSSTMNPAVSSKLYYLSGRPHNGGAPNLRSIATSALVLRDSGQTNSFAVRMAPMRNWYDDTQIGVPDVAVFQTSGNSFYVYLGDENASSERFANNTRITVVGPTGRNLGNGGLGASRGYNPNLGMISRTDLDGDGLDDLAVTTATGADPIYVFYGSSVPDDLSSGQLSYTSAAVIAPSARPGTTSRTIQPVGDLTGDGALDLVMGEPQANSNAGGITILY